MKKTVLFAAALFAGSAAFAQTGEITSNRGENWLSQDGDWGLTFSANPILNYAGNLFNGTAGNNIGSGLTWLNNDMVIRGKKLIDANTAYRGELRIGFNSDKGTQLVDAIPQPTPAPVPATTVENTSKHSTMNINLGAGLEKRVGSTRVVGVYGAMFNIGFGTEKTKNEFGNALSADNPASNTTEVKMGSTFMLGLNAFAGIEWFFAPKMSLSGEYTWGLSMTSTGTGETTTDTWDGAKVVTTTIEGSPNDGVNDKVSHFGIDTGVSGAALLGLNFYFQ